MLEALKSGDLKLYMQDKKGDKKAEFIFYDGKCRFSIISLVDDAELLRQIALKLEELNKNAP